MTGVFFALQVDIETNALAVTSSGLNVLDCDKVPAIML